MTQNQRLTLGPRMLPQSLPSSVVYTIGGAIVPDLPRYPDADMPEHVDIPDAPRGKATLHNGLTARADAMARWVAAGATLADAYRNAYSPPASKTPAAIQRSATLITCKPKWTVALQYYREERQAKQSQTSIPVADFVKGRLVLEAQHARQDSARIQALRLLGMTEGLFTTVHKTERTLDPAQLASLKDKLDQRLRSVLGRLGGTFHNASYTALDASDPISSVSGQDDPQMEVLPLLAAREPSSRPDTIPVTGSAEIEAPPISAEGPVIDIGAGYAADFEGPLFIAGGLRGDPK